MKLVYVISLALPWIYSVNSIAQTYVAVEGASAWQSRNDQRIPGDTGTKFALTDFKSSAFPAYRIYLGHIWNKTHELRGLYAPLELHTKGYFDKSVVFRDITFAADTETKAYYRFNSYRLTYAYHFPDTGSWDLAIGFTGKIRDAEVRLSQGDLRESKKNIGFVPLLNLQATRPIGSGWTFRFDFDGLAAPQGRAFDVALFFERDFSWQGLSAFGGYRTVEGGADNKKVYNFAWIHYATLGLRGSF